MEGRQDPAVSGRRELGFVELSRIGGKCRADYGQEGMVDPSCEGKSNTGGPGLWIRID
jgi:hypothetical protein